MTKEADMLALAETLSIVSSADNKPAALTIEALRIAADALRTAARQPAVNREAVAKIIYTMVGGGSEGDWNAGYFPDDTRNAYAATDAILALLPRPAAGEAVAWPAIPDDDADFTPDLARKIIAKYQSLIPPPDQAGRDPATIEAVADSADFGPAYDGEDFVTLTFRVRKDQQAISGIWHLSQRGAGTCEWAVKKYPDKAAERDAAYATLNRT